MNSITEKKLAIAESIIITSAKIIKSANELPKKNKYFFTRKYIRGLSRQNKKKKAVVLFNLSFSSLMGAVDVARIFSTPIPKFNK